MKSRQVAIAAASTLLLLTIMLNSTMTCAKAENENASLQAANSSIKQAFKNLLAAEKAGGDVTQLLTRLNNAGEFLAQAENAYRSGNLVSVTSEAENARLVANQVSNDALNLQNASTSRSQNSFLLTLIFSFDGAFAFVIVLLLVWRRFKRDYMKKLLASKPEGVQNTA